MQILWLYRNRQVGRLFAEITEGVDALGLWTGIRSESTVSTLSLDTQVIRSMSRHRAILVRVATVTNAHAYDDSRQLRDGSE